MLEFLTANGATIIVSALLAVIVGLIIFGMIKNKRSGKSNCGCGCASCPMNGKCHIENKDK